jgi:hypothetical protein
MQRYREQKVKQRRPFWLPASNFYVLAVAATLAVFFLLWGILHDGGAQTPLVPAGLAASIVLATAVILREVILRRARNRFLAHQRSLDRSVAAAAPRRNDPADFKKLTLERNAAILKEISQKSQAARTLTRLSAAHREVFDLCEEYLAVTQRELPNVGVGSPRLAAIRRGQDRAQELRHYHLLQWASIETRSLTEEARAKSRFNEKMDLAKRALNVVDFAAGVYPDERSLLDSEQLLRELITSIKVADFVQKAERSAFKGHTERAIGQYKDALFELKRADAGSVENRDVAMEKITSEISKLENLTGESDSRLNGSRH